MAQGEHAYVVSVMTGCLVPAHMGTHVIRLAGWLKHVLLVLHNIECKLNIWWVCCSHHQRQDGFCSKLLLLKAQAVATIGDLKAAIEVVQEWQQDCGHKGIATVGSPEADAAASWQQAWQEAADAKDVGNDMFRQGDFTGKCTALH